MEVEAAGDLRPKRRRCLLTYYATGDARQRGQPDHCPRPYAAVGWQLENDQLPDYLPNILELAACEQKRS